ncbi:MAG: DNA alkylation repair protein [Muribaculaceae bacterium]|nr:DNA alkylation repair protein [Muribaculaceae bacterium]
MTEFNKIQELKRRFFAMRNGIIADTLRKAGSPYKIIFGLNLPQLSEIAASLGTDADMAEYLWANNSTRESMMLAPMLYPLDKFTIDTARSWIDRAVSTEASDVLCHRLLRYQPYAHTLILEYADDPCDLKRYIALRLLWRFLSSHTGEAKTIADNELKRNCAMTRTPALQLLDEIDYLLSGDACS